MSNRYGYSGTVGHTQAIRSNSGVFSPNDIIDLESDNVWFKAGQLELIQTQTASSVTTLDFTNLGSYNIHFLTATNLESSHNNFRWSVRFYESGVLESGNNYKWVVRQQLDGGSNSDFNDDSHDSIPIQLEQPTGRIAGGGYTYFYNLIDSTKYSFTTNHHNRSTGGIIAEFGSGVMTQTSEVTGFQISGYDSSSAAFSGTFSLYGIKEYS